VQVSLLEPGDRLLSHDLQWIAVEDLLDTGETEAVYNLRIADYHTYFVCGWNWSFNVWSHNACLEEVRVSQSDETGMRAARAAFQYRSSHNLTSFGDNVALAKASQNPLPTVNVSGGGRHAEEKLIQTNLPSPAIINQNNQIQYLFTERSSCGGPVAGPQSMGHNCYGQIDTWLRNQSGKVIIYYLVPYVQNGSQAGEVQAAYGSLNIT
jgi:Pretoxin HINT domain